jgi:hypothetical protein
VSNPEKNGAAYLIVRIDEGRSGDETRLIPNYDPKEASTIALSLCFSCIS